MASTETTIELELVFVSQIQISPVLMEITYNIIYRGEIYSTEKIYVRSDPDNDNDDGIEAAA